MFELLDCWIDRQTGLIYNLMQEIRMVKIAPHITVNAKVRFGKPVIAGTRVPVDLIVGKIAGGMAVDEVMAEYDLTRGQVLAALRYAADLVSQEEIALQ